MTVPGLTGEGNGIMIVNLLALCISVVYCIMLLTIGINPVERSKDSMQS